MALLLESSLERSSTVVALGGGVVGDMAGFAAATYLRESIGWLLLLHFWRWLIQPGRENRRRYPSG